jgi:hypothetical protein
MSKPEIGIGLEAKAELAKRIALQVEEEAGGYAAFEVLSLAASLLFGVKCRLRLDP